MTEFGGDMVPETRRNHMIEVVVAEAEPEGFFIHMIKVRGRKRIFWSCGGRCI